MAQLYIKANELEEKDTVKVFNERGKEVYYTKDDFIATGHRIKIYLANWIVSVTVMLIYLAVYLLFVIAFGGIILGFDEFPLCWGTKVALSSSLVESTIRTEKSKSA